MSSARFISITALYTALLIGVQFALSGVPGVELVTVLLLSFCFTMGVKAGVTVAVCFSAIRCLLFGFFPSVLALYLVYYTGFALFFGFLGNVFHRKITLKALVCVDVLAVVFTAMFSLLDDVITPLFYGLGKNAAIAYFYSSLPFMLSQCICAAISVGLLFVPISKALTIALTKVKR
jgi:hypothetical protein